MKYSRTERLERCDREIAIAAGLLADGEKPVDQVLVYWLDWQLERQLIEEEA